MAIVPNAAQFMSKTIDGSLPATPLPVPALTVNKWKTKAIELYRLATMPWRTAKRRRLARQGKLPVYSIFYHRVSNDYQNDWTMSEAEFTRQIDWFEKHFDLVSLSELQKRIDSGFNNRPTLAITFDDGYAENCQFALPLLIERGIPVCYFVTIDYVTSQEPFPHDVALGNPLPVNTVESLRALSRSGVEIGAHTRTHSDMGAIDDPQELSDELVTASREIEEHIGCPVQYFAFPFGQRKNMNPEAFRILKDHGFLGVCSAYGGWNEIGEDSFHIKRIHGDPSFERVRNWLSFDPRVGRIGPYIWNEASSPVKEGQEAVPVNVTNDRRSGARFRMPDADSQPAKLPAINPIEASDMCRQAD